MAAYSQYQRMLCVMLLSTLGASLAERNLSKIVVNAGALQSSGEVMSNSSKFRATGTTGGPRTATHDATQGADALEELRGRKIADSNESGGWSRLLGKNLPRMSKKGFWISAEEKGGTGRSLKVARSAAHIQASQTLTRRHKAAGNERTDDGSNTPAGSPVEKSSTLAKLLHESDLAVTKLLEFVKHADMPHVVSPEKVELLKVVDKALDESSATLGQPTMEGSVTESQKADAAPASKDIFTEYRLTKGRIQKIAAEQDGVVLVTWANFQYLDFVQNWLSHMRKIKVTTYLVGAMDEDLLQALIDSGEKNVFAMDSTLESGDLSWGSRHFFAMGREKIQLLERVATMGVDVLVSDIDTVWLRNPFPYLARYPEADILTSSDLLHNTSNTDSLENVIGSGNIGVTMFRKSALGFAREWNYRLAQDPNLWDQNGFNELIIRKVNDVGVRGDNLIRGYNGTMLIGTLPVALFTSGHTYHAQNLAEVMGLGSPYVVHNTFQFSGTPGKRHRFRERLLWNVDPDEYYDPPGGLVSFDLHVDEFLEPASHLDLKGSTLGDFKPHFDLVHNQLSQLRNAMAIALVLNRTLVLPHFWSGSDRWWAPFHGVIPGSQVTQFPRQVPADFLLDLEVMSQSQTGQSGSALRFREYSFLNNSRVPAEILEESVTVTLCEDDDDYCRGSFGVYDTTSNSIAVNSGLSDQNVKRIFLEDFHDAKLLHFEDVRDIFGGFESESDARRFELQTQLYASIFCCVEGNPGHVWYDMWWEFPGHVDRHNRIIQEWTPILGP